MGAIAIASTLLAGFSTINQMDLADDEEQIKDQQIRSQEVQARLQDAQQGIAEQDKLRSTIATASVMAGSRGISDSSASIRAIFNHDYEQYDEDKDARRLNLSGKELGLDFEAQNAQMIHDSQTSNAWMGFAKNELSLGAAGAQGSISAGSRPARIPTARSSVSSGEVDINPI